MPGFSLSDALQISTAAKDYARLQILKGSTQLENNKLNDYQLDSLKVGIGSTEGTRAELLTHKTPRGRLKESLFGMRDIQDKKTLSTRLETTHEVAVYESMIATSSKYSLGNCEELTFQALDYILTVSNSSINAEVFCIGDHAILVVNRNARSDPKNPETWGPAAICDPWSNNVFPASEYLTELKNYYREGRINYTENFDAAKHELFCSPIYNTTHLRQHRNVDKLYRNLETEIKKLITILNQYHEMLQNEVNNVYSKYKLLTNKTAIVSNKIEEVENVINHLNDFITTIRYSDDDDGDYREVKNKLEEDFLNIFHKCIQTMTFSPKDLAQLYDYKFQFSTFFEKEAQIQKQLQKNIIQITKNINATIGKLLANKVETETTTKKPS